MSENPAGATKTCSACGKDVTSRPRVRDSEGHYFCRECAAEKRSELARRLSDTATGIPGVDPDDAAIMAGLVDDSLSRSAEFCPACRRSWTEGSVICTACGYAREGTAGTGADHGRGNRGARWKVVASILVIILLLVALGIYLFVPRRP